MSTDVDILCKEIHSFVDPASFAQHPTHIFRERVAQYLRHTIQLSVKLKEGVNTYDENILKKVLFNSHDDVCSSSHKTNMYGSKGMPWYILCKNHDSIRRANASMKHSRTTISALYVVIGAMRDPNIVPSCLTSIIVLGMLSVCIEVFSSAAFSSGMRLGRSRPSSLCVIESAIMCMLQERPSTMMSKCIERYVYERMMCKLSFDQNESSILPPIKDVMKDYNTRRSLIVLLIANDLVSMKKAKNSSGADINIVHRLQQQTIIRPTILLLKEIDALDVYLLQRYRETKSVRARDLCSRCRIKLISDKSQQNKRIKTSSIGHLHGETPGDEMQSSIASTSRYSRTVCNNSSDLLPWKAMMSASISEMPRESCYVCSMRNLEGKYNSSMDITSLSMSWIEFRAELYKVLLESIDSLIADTAWAQNLLLSVFRMAIYHHQSASTRLCALFAANCAGVENGVFQYLNFILKVTEKDVDSPNKSVKTLSRISASIYIYRELLMDCAIFDDSEMYWKGLRPLFDFLLKLNEHKKQDGEIISVTTQIQTSLGILLAKWCSLNSSKSSRQSCLVFNGYILRFSDEFGSIDNWLDDRMSTKERHLVTLALQKLGISSLLDSIEDATSNEATTCHQKSLWIYDDIHSMQAAYTRMGPRVKAQTLFSKKNIEIEENVKRKRRHRAESFDGEPIFDFINDDITRVIFSYLGYKLLVRATSVCRSWKQIGNENTYWEPHFIKRFRPVFLEDLIPVTTSATIKESFITKHCKREAIIWRQKFNEERQFEKSLQSRISTTTGYKYRHCRVFGCTVVFRKKEDEKKHAQVHDKDVKKKLATIQRAERRKINRLVVGKTKHTKETFS